MEGTLRLGLDHVPDQSGAGLPDSDPDRRGDQPHHEPFAAAGASLHPALGDPGDRRSGDCPERADPHALRPADERAVPRGRNESSFGALHPAATSFDSVSHLDPDGVAAE
ncbi:hypothetical protein SDC9_190286 [bioreactor metagenome]|uniref:Uncharacterized protein n=1 Tax=bioreactor metagenome TaxID=1076179 RepID=A0A645HX23_9ZZZZ